MGLSRTERVKAIDSPHDDGCRYSGAAWGAGRDTLEGDPGFPWCNLNVVTLKRSAEQFLLIVSDNNSSGNAVYHKTRK